MWCVCVVCMSMCCMYSKRVRVYVVCVLCACLCVVCVVCVCVCAKAFFVDCLHQTRDESSAFVERMTQNTNILGLARTARV